MTLNPWIFVGHPPSSVKHWIAIHPTAMCYVQDKLEAQWDAIENKSYGVHDPMADVWKSLVPNAPDLVLSGFSYAWDKTALTPTQKVGEPYYNTYNYPYTSEKMDFSRRPFTIEVVCSPSVCRRWCSQPWTNSLESWVGDGATYLERIYATRLGLACSYQPSYFVTIRNGADHEFSIFDSTGQKQTKTGRDATYGPAPTIMAFCGNVAAGAHIYAVRVYGKALTADEVAHNHSIDQLRFGIP